jgi:hypothetical protein
LGCPSVRTPESSFRMNSIHGHNEWKSFLVGWPPTRRANLFLSEPTSGN